MAYRPFCHSQHDNRTPLQDSSHYSPHRSCLHISRVPSLQWEWYYACRPHIEFSHCSLRQKSASVLPCFSGRSECSFRPRAILRQTSSTQSKHNPRQCLILLQQWVRNLYAERMLLAVTDGHGEGLVGIDIFGFSVYQIGDRGVRKLVFTTDSCTIRRIILSFKLFIFI